MRTRIVMMTAIAMMAIQFNAAQTPTKKFTTEEQKIAFATKNLLAGLRSSNPGVMQSVMRISAQMKMQYPSADISDVVNGMNEVLKQHPSGAMRYKAYLAISICENPNWFVHDIGVVTTDDEGFFKAASTRLQKQLLSVNSL